MYFCVQQGTVSANLLILSLINEFGTVASAMLGALFVLAYKEKATTEATVKSVSDAFTVPIPVFV